MLLLLCPFCRQEYADDLECLDCGRLDSLRCQNPFCAKRFSFLIRECPACGDESVFTWTDVPAPTVLAGLFCRDCGVPFNDAAIETQNQDAAQRIQ